MCNLISLTGNRTPVPCIARRILNHWTTREVPQSKNVYTFLLSLKSFLQFSSIQLLSHVQLFATPWTAACQASLFITNSQSLLRLMSMESVMPSNHLILCRPLLLLPSIFPTIRVFSNESVLHIRWPKYWEFQLQHQSFQWIFKIDFL